MEPLRCVLLVGVQFGLQVDQFGLQAQVSDDVSAVKEGINVYKVGQASIAEGKDLPQLQGCPEVDTLRYTIAPYN